VPESFEAYQVNLPPELVKYTGAATDPVMKALREHALEQKWPQGRFDDTLSLIKVFADKGVLVPLFDPAAEAAKLGDKGAARRQDVEIFAKSLKSRNEITDEEFGEMASLAATAAGVQLVEKLRKMMGDAGKTPIDAPSGGDQSASSPAMAEAQTMRADPRYGKDSTFTRSADRKWVAAWEADKTTK
jgi:hypothetical protein